MSLYGDLSHQEIYFYAYANSTFCMCKNALNPDKFKGHYSRGPTLVTTALTMGGPRRTGGLTSSCTNRNAPLIELRKTDKT